MSRVYSPVEKTLKRSLLCMEHSGETRGGLNSGLGTGGHVVYLQESGLQGRSPSFPSAQGKV